MARPSIIACVLVVALSPLSAAAQHAVSQATSPRLQLTGDIGVTVAPAENLAVAATTVQVRLYSREGLGGLLRVGYEGLLYLNFGVIDVAAAYRAELPGGQWAGVGLGVALGVSAMIRDSVYHFTGDDVAIGLFTTAGVDFRFGSLILGLDVLGRWQLAAVPILGDVQTRGIDWTEVGAVIRIGGEVLL